MRCNMRLKVGLSLRHVVSQCFGFPIERIVVRLGQGTHRLVEFRYCGRILLRDVFVGIKKPAFFLANHRSSRVHNGYFSDNGKFVLTR